MIALKRSGSLRTAALFLLALLLAACSGDLTGPGAEGNQGVNAPGPGGPVPEGAREGGDRDDCVMVAGRQFCQPGEGGKPQIEDEG